MTPKSSGPTCHLGKNRIFFTPSSLAFAGCCQLEGEPGRGRPSVIHPHGVFRHRAQEEPDSMATACRPRAHADSAAHAQHNLFLSPCHFSIKMRYLFLPICFCMAKTITANLKYLELATVHSYGT